MNADLRHELVQAGVLRPQRGEKLTPFYNIAGAPVLRIDDTGAVKAAHKARYVPGSPREPFRGNDMRGAR